MSFPAPLPLIFGDFAAASTETASTSTAQSTVRDLGIDLETRELLVEDGDLVLLTDAPAVEQNVDIAINLFLGEWYLNIEEGIPFFDRILVKSPDLAEIKSILSDHILKVEGVVAIVALDLVRNAQTRSLDVAWRAQFNLDGVNGIANSFTSIALLGA